MADRTQPAFRNAYYNYTTKAPYHYVPSRNHVSVSPYDYYTVVKGSRVGSDVLYEQQELDRTRARTAGSMPGSPTPSSPGSPGSPTGSLSQTFGSSPRSGPNSPLLTRPSMSASFRSTTRSARKYQFAPDGSIVSEYAQYNKGSPRR